jgi:hypothetical protein
VSYAVAEYSAVEAKYLSKVEYDHIPIQAGDKLEGNIENLEEQEGAYPLKKGEEILEGEKTYEVEYCNISVQTEGDGYCKGNSVIAKGEFVLLTAIPESGSVFQGWFDEAGTLLSDSSEYRFQVTGDVSLLARFSKEEAGDPVDVFIRRLYTTCLGREADADGLEYWKGRINSGSLKGIGLAGSFAFSGEFKKKNYCDEHFVRQLYVALMGREADDGGLAFWTGKLRSGMTREAMVNSFTSSKEYKGLCSEAGIELGTTLKDTHFGAKAGIGTKPYGPCAVCGDETKVVQFAERMYTVCLGRTAEAGGLAYWSKGLYEQTITGKSIVNFFFLCNEIKNKNLSNREYVRRIYKVMLDREPDQGGWNFWTGRLDSGASPTAVIAGFIDSKEFTGICNDYGIKRK